MTEDMWKDPNLHSLAVIFDGRAQPTGIRERGSDATILLLFNGHHREVSFSMPPAIDGDRWQLVLQTDGDAQAIGTISRPAEMVRVADRSLAVYVMQRAAG